MGEYTVTGVNVYNPNTRTNIIAYPSPANQTLYVDFSSIEELQEQTFRSATIQQKYYDVRLFNTQGSLVRSVQSAGEQISLDVSGLPGGNYFLHVYKNGTTEPQVHKIIIRH